MNSILKLLFSFTSISLLNKIIPLITVPLLTNNLGLENYGKYVFTIAIIGFLETVINFGLKTTGVNELILCNGIKDESKLFFIVLIIKGGLLILSFLMFYGLFLFSMFDDLEALFYCIPFTFGYVFNQEWFFHGKKQMTIVAILTIIVRIIFLAAIYIYIQSPKDLNLALLLSSSSFFILSILETVIAIFRYGITLNVSIKIIDFKQHILKSVHFFLTTLNVYFISSFNYILLGNFYEINSVGVYAIADKVVKATTEISTLINKSIYPTLSNLFKFNKVKYQNLVIRIKRIQYFLFSIFIILVIYNSKIIFGFFNSDFSQLNLGVCLLIILSLSLPFQALNSFSALRFVIMQKQKLLFNISIIISITSLVLLSLVGYHLNIEYFAIANVLISFFFWTLLNINLSSLNQIN